jgi:SPP1 gp7 family putative phage head morphogenesis protein
MEEWDDIFSSMISAIESGELKPGQVDDAAISHWANKMMGAVEQGTGKKIGAPNLSQSDQRMLEALQSNLTVFNAFKNHAEIIDLHAALIDDDGNLRSFDDWLKKAKAIDTTYNVHYYRAEYNHAVNSSMMISRWQQFQEEKDITPNLRYEAIMDARTRDSHRNLNGTIRPIEDPFWQTYFPPNGWNCRCEAIQTDEPANAVPDKLPKLGEMFDRNPGQEQSIFDVDKMPYAASLANEQRMKIRVNERIKGNWNIKLTRKDRELIYKLPLEEQYHTFKEFKNGGKVRIHKAYEYNANDHDYKLDFALEYAKKNKALVDFMPDINVEDKEARKLIMPDANYSSNPDFSINSKLWEFKTTAVLNEDKLWRKIRNAFKQSDKVIYSFIDTLPDEMTIKNLNKKSKNKDIKHDLIFYKIKKSKQL